MILLDFFFWTWTGSSRSVDLLDGILDIFFTRGSFLTHLNTLFLGLGSLIGLAIETYEGLTGGCSSTYYNICHGTIWGYVAYRVSMWWSNSNYFVVGFHAVITNHCLPWLYYMAPGSYKLLLSYASCVGTAVILIPTHCWFFTFGFCLTHCHRTGGLILTKPRSAGSRFVFHNVYFVVPHDL